MTDLMTIGSRLRQIRSEMGLSQKALASDIGVSQTAVSRLENGEDIYASALLAILMYLRSKVSLDYLVSSDFSVDSHWLNHHSEEEVRQFLIRHLDILRDAINSSNDASLQQLELMRRRISGSSTV